MANNNQQGQPPFIAGKLIFTAVEAYDDEDAGRTAREALLPYLAMQFTPRTTHSVWRGRRNQCGFVALARSYSAALSALGWKDVPQISPDQLRGLMSTADFQEISLAFYKDYEQMKGGQSLNQLRARENISENTMICLLRTLNRVHGTGFRLGIITKGYSIGERQEQTSACLTPTIDPLLPQPVVWVCNDNAETVAQINALNEARPTVTLNIDTTGMTEDEISVEKTKAAYKKIEGKPDLGISHWVC